mgnify:CR=1 FL=1
MATPVIWIEPKLNGDMRFDLKCTTATTTDDGENWVVVDPESSESDQTSKTFEFERRKSTYSKYRHRLLLLEMSVFKQPKNMKDTCRFIPSLPVPFDTTLVYGPVVFVLLDRHEIPLALDKNTFQTHWSALVESPANLGFKYDNRSGGNSPLSKWLGKQMQTTYTSNRPATWMIEEDEESDEGD